MKFASCKLDEKRLTRGCGWRRGKFRPMSNAEGLESRNTLSILSGADVALSQNELLQMSSETRFPAP